MRVLPFVLIGLGLIGLTGLTSYDLYGVIHQDDPARVLVSEPWWRGSLDFYAVGVGVLASGIGTLLIGRRQQPEA